MNPNFSLSYFTTENFPQFWKTVKKYTGILRNYIRKHPIIFIVLMLGSALSILPWIQRRTTSLTISETTNYASYKNGGEIVATPDTTPCELSKFEVFGFKIANIKSDPSWTLNPEARKPFCFNGNNGIVIIKLGEEISVSGIKIDQANSREISPSSAPRQIEVSVSQDNDLYWHIGTFTLRNDEPSKVHKVHPLVTEKTAKYVKIKTKSNWGNADHTCIKMIHVYG